jgi:hypothetical protein
MFARSPLADGFCLERRETKEGVAAAILAFGRNLSASADSAAMPEGVSRW